VATLWWFTAAPKPLKIQVFWGSPSSQGSHSPYILGDTTRPGHVTCVLVWSKSDRKRLRKTLHKQTNKQTDRQTDTTKIMVTWPWTKNEVRSNDYWRLMYRHELNPACEESRFLSQPRQCQNDERYHHHELSKPARTHIHLGLKALTRVRPIPCWRPIPDTIGCSCTDTDTDTNTGNDITYNWGMHTLHTLCIAYVSFKT